jgi:hypothetical protein
VPAVFTQAELETSKTDVAQLSLAGCAKAPEEKSSTEIKNTIVLKAPVRAGKNSFIVEY